MLGLFAYIIVKSRTIFHFLVYIFGDFPFMVLKEKKYNSLRIRNNQLQLIVRMRSSQRLSEKLGTSEALVSSLSRLNRIVTKWRTSLKIEAS